MSFALRGVNEVVAASAKAAANVDVACGIWANEAALYIERQAKQIVTVDTGQLRRSIMSDPAVGGGGAPWVALVYPSVIYGRRVELGFTGNDAIGRYYRPSVPYNAHGKPYLRPAIDNSRADLAALFVARVTEALSAR